MEALHLGVSTLRQPRIGLPAVTRQLEDLGDSLSNGQEI